MPEFISDEDIEKALDWLRDGAFDLGKAKERAVRAEKMTKHTQAILMQQYNILPVSAQEREAKAHPKFLAALEEEAISAGEYERLKALREAAALKINVWQTMSANNRATRI